MIVYLPCGCRAALQQKKSTLSGEVYKISPIQQHRKTCKLDVLVKLKSFTLPWRPIIKRDPCAYCGDPGGTVDHIVPQSLNGNNAWTNLTGACLECNCKKSSKGLLVYLLERNHDSQSRALPNHGA